MWVRPFHFRTIRLDLLSAAPARDAAMERTANTNRCRGCVLRRSVIGSERHQIQMLWRKVDMKIKPLNDRILVVRVEEEKKTSGGIIIPDTAKEKPQEGKVVAVGPGKMGDDGKRIALDIKAGDRVLFSKYGGTEIKVDGVEHLFMREDDILGIID
jgi:chaperonin GroES